MATDETSAPPYGSAHDLPGFVERRQQIAGLKLVTRFFARGQRRSLLELEARQKAICDLVDRFYEVLGVRHWIFTEHLPTSEIEALLDGASSAEVAEAGLIAIISERVHGRHWEMGLRGHEAMRARWAGLERARQHYLDEQWSSCALVLVALMDGFVNDFEPAKRRGLHTREPGEMVAWDSLVGHHKGLTSVMSVFLKSFKRRHDDEVFELHRHGIVHGTVVNYDNQIVATKAWNMLSAVIDWATATEKAATSPPAKPTVREAVGSVIEYASRQRYREGFEPWSMGSDDDRFADLDVVGEATKFLESWRASRWALVAAVLPSVLVTPDMKPGERASRAKQVYEHSPLVEFTIDQVSFPQASVAVISGTATIGERRGPLEIRWIHERPDGNLAQLGDAGARWVLAVYPPHTFIKE